MFSGTEADANFRVVDIMMVPCGMRETTIGGDEDRVPQDCNYDREALTGYLSSIKMNMYYNQGQILVD